MSAIPLRFAVLFLTLAGVAAAQTNHRTITNTVRNALGVPTAGFGRIDASSVSGQIVARVEW